MPAIIVSLKEGASAQELEKAKQTVKDQGGWITQEYTLIKGFAADFPEDVIVALKSNEHIEVESDGKVTTQSNN